MTMFRATLVVCLVAAGLAAEAGEEPRPLRGFSEASARTQRDLEARFRALPAPDNIRGYMERLAARPHHAGSSYGKENAEWMLALFREWGWDAAIETFDVLMPTPKLRAVELVAPTRFVAKLEEPALRQDPTSGQKREQLPTYNAFSVDGDVVAPLVYVNYGIPEDYEQLDRLGVSVKGAIVIARYGRSWRGVKPKLAAEHGAVGCIIYSDPREDGYFQGDVFPAGAWRPKDGVQRGSVLDVSHQPGDPLTPGVGATKDAKRLALADAKAITKIPVLPISYGDAQPLLAALAGPVAPEAWRGALPITYHVGAGPARVRLAVKSSWDVTTVHNVVARIPGATDPDEWVLRGNHHDAWVNGAEDPTSGMAPMLEEARALGELRKQGWQPRRTIVYCAWDAEEPMLLGSTEWAEHHAQELKQKAVAYLNTDSNGRGFLSVQGSHSLQDFVNEVARDVPDPETKLSAWKREQLRRIAQAKKPEDREELRRRADLRIDALGSGSDYTAFIDHLGIASLNLYYGNEDGGGIYHSIYDDFYWYSHFSDSEFVYGRALAQTVGTAVLRLAGAEVLPFEFGGLAETVKTYADELKALLKQRQDEAAERNRQLDEGVFDAIRDPRRPTPAPPRKDVPPHLNFAPLENAVGALTRSAAAFAKAWDDNAGAGLSETRRRALNRKLVESERRLTAADGLPHRPWFKHLLYAPGSYTGYGVKTIPGVREAIELDRYAEAEQEIGRAAEALGGLAAHLDEAASDLSR
jgi:N-acetylated-alpha-linked acidic dipeptidase